jgi:enamine deaminase RidA (YjgF/YER057c/UK114 family)
LEGKLELVTHRKLKGGRLMPWGKGTVVTGAKGFVFLSGNTATADDYDPFKMGGGAVGDAAAQWRNILTNIKSDLEELGTSLDHLIRLTFFVKGPFPNGGVLSSPNFRQEVMDEFFAQHCSKHCSYNNPPPSEVIGVAALAHPDLVIEIVAVAAVPD